LYKTTQTGIQARRGCGQSSPAEVNLSPSSQTSITLDKTGSCLQLTHKPWQEM